MYDNLLAEVPTDLWIGGRWRKSHDGSGLGREGAHEGMMEFLESQYVSVVW